MSDSMQESAFEDKPELVPSNWGQKILSPSRLAIKCAKMSYNYLPN